MGSTDHRASSPIQHEGELEREQAQREMAEGEKEGQGAGESVDSPPALRSPKDVINRIFSQLDCVDLLHCSLVCKQWYTDSAEHREAWKNEYLEAYIARGLSIKRETHPPSESCSIKGLHSWCF